MSICINGAGRRYSSDWLAEPSIGLQSGILCDLGTGFLPASPSFVRHSEVHRPIAYYRVILRVVDEQNFHP